MKAGNIKKFILLPVLFIAITLSGFRHLRTENSAQNTPSPAESIHAKFIADIEKFSQSVAQFRETLHPEFYNSENAKMLFFRIREMYKQIEFLLAYTDPQAAENFNGANILSGDPNTQSNEISEPRGMQVIEEILFEETAETELTKMDALAQQLLADTKLFKAQTETHPFSNTMILDACRKEIIRICFLGLTGFDSPVAKNSISEAIASLKNLQTTIQFYEEEIADKNTLLEIQSTFAEAITYLSSHSDFDTLNRLHFTREYGNVLYGLMFEMFGALQVSLPEELTDFHLPMHSEAKNLFDENFLNPSFYSLYKSGETTQERTQLGKLLFFDPILSVNNKRACASCHQPAKAFTDGFTKSNGLNFTTSLKRNAPTLVNAALQGKFFYDVRADFPETQIDHVVFHADEFNTTYEAIIQKLKQSPEYVQMFQKAFPLQEQNPVTKFTITSSVADYVRSLIAMDSEFDKYIRHESESISQQVINGYNLFMGKAQCGTCHFAPTFYGTVPPDFTESETEVIGVPATNDTIHTTLDADKGRYVIQNVPVYEFAFKTQTVRNINLTAPYMHNGVFKTLEEVMDFYNRGGGEGLHIAPQYQTLPPDKLNLTKAEIADIISFMQALTDTSGVTSIPAKLPAFPHDGQLNNRKTGGEY